MQYLVHVIDNSSNFEKNEKDIFQISLGYSNNNEECYVFQSDAFYKIESESVVKAVEDLTKIIRIENENGEKILLSEALKSTQSKQENMDLDNFIIIEDNEKRCNCPYFGIVEVQCKIENKWVEFHKIQFFVVEESKIMQIVN
ncbi:MAG TPA: hypothetical protein VMZ91_08755 [Candidatus Paceibacterota bacterium]|nr:hypothetical protein [Candidatus Paceibacterota bacterium]